MYLEKITLLNYKNFDSISFDFINEINCFVGNNGVGKTNVLDAIYHLAFTRGYFNSVTTQNIQHDKDFFMIEGVFDLNGRTSTVSCSFKKGQKKIVKLNDKIYDKLSEHIGLIPLVIISPNDTNLILEGSEVRRKFLDGVIAQSDKGYMADLIAYAKTLSQRNALLKYFAANHTFDMLNLNIYNDQLVAIGVRIFTKRQAFCEEFLPIFKKRYQQISGRQESINLAYKSQLKEGNFATLLAERLERDRLLQYTTVGVHKDDLIFSIDGYPIKKYGSQGQQKTYLIALKLAEFDFLKQQSNVKPILLLDDIFDKLDAQRVTEIINLVNDENFGQIFITDTHADRTEKAIKEISQRYKMFQL
ncbi:DNA replication/repair protein RecF [Flavobacteriaceae bacterium F08102]|nr:DNA replication/repair protein RecF [Flavobacteriaceae bacterium F08102]